MLLQLLVLTDVIRRCLMIGLLHFAAVVLVSQFGEMQSVIFSEQLIFLEP